MRAPVEAAIISACESLGLSVIPDSEHSDTVFAHPTTTISAHPTIGIRAEEGEAYALVCAIIARVPQSRSMQVLRTINGLHLKMVPGVRFILVDGTLAVQVGVDLVNEGESRLVIDLGIRRCIYAARTASTQIGALAPHEAVLSHWNQALLAFLGWGDDQSAG